MATTTNIQELPHVRQKSDWDCGIACVEMVLKYFFGEKFNNEAFISLGKMLGFGTRVWTIDLATILLHYRIECVYHTITCGVDPGYKNQEYYKSCFQSDEIRVNKLFENAKELGLNIIRGTVTMEIIFSKLDQGWAVIILVNSNLLRCTLCEEKWTNVSMFFPWTVSSLQVESGNHYEGHYVILCGYDMAKQVLFYKNPSQADILCCTDVPSFESARHSYGTDDDIIFIDLKKCDKMKQ